MPKWLDTEKGQELLKKAFETADLPEIEKKHLEPGTYTNREIAEKFDNPLKLIGLLMKLPAGSPTSKRSILSIAIDMIMM